ncbi:MAG: MBL fold metallo-hydrolase [Dehalococcoidia bacterium]|nr:MBL fold metallo-hydrolase [Dehalococcoidia bacterium]
MNVTRISIDWLGVATFRLRVGNLVVFLDAYMDRVPSAPPVGLHAADVTEADFVLVGHSHFDHLAGAELIARNTGARIIGSNETCRVMREQGVASEQLVPSQGGEHHRLSDAVSVRVYPGLHSCTWCAGTLDFDEEARGHLGLTEDERARAGGLGAAIAAAMSGDSQQARELRDHLRTAVGSRETGGALVYVIETPAGSIFYQDTSGCWTGVMRQLRADVALLAAAGRANVDAEPVQGSLAGFVAREAAMLQARTVLISHHDDWMPPVTRDTTDVSAIRAELARQAPAATLLEPGYLAGTVLFE